MAAREGGVAAAGAGFVLAEGRGRRGGGREGFEEKGQLDGACWVVVGLVR